MDEIRLRLKLQNFQQEKQGDKRKENLEFKAPISQEEIDEYKADFEDLEGVDDISEPDLEDVVEDAELSEAEIEQKKDEIKDLLKERDDIPDIIQQLKDLSKLEEEKINNAKNIDELTKTTRLYINRKRLNNGFCESSHKSSYYSLSWFV